MVPIIEECIELAPELEVEVRVGNLNEGVTIAKQVEMQGCQVIISRGGTAKMIRESVRIPVVDVTLSGYDMLRSFMLANDFKGKKAIIGFSNLTVGAQAIIDLLELRFKAFTIDTAEEVDPLIKTLKDEGYKRILGDVVTVEVSSKYGLDGILIQSGKEAILESFESAKSQFYFHKETQRLMELMRETLKVKEQDLCMMSESGDILFEHWQTIDKTSLEVIDFQVLRKEILGHQEPIMKVIETLDHYLDITGSLLDDKEEKVVVFFVSKRVKREYSLPWLKMEEIVKPLQLISESEEMKQIVKQVNPSEFDHDLTLFVGEKGTGKAELAKYMHAHNESELGLFATIDFQYANFTLLNEVVTDRIKTLYLENIKLKSKDDVEQLIEIQSICDKNKISFLGSTDQLTYDFEFIPFNKKVIHVPTLSERKEDMRELVRSFIVQFNQSLGSKPVRIREEAMTLILQQRWKENINSLKMFIKKLVLIESEYVVRLSTVEELLSTESEYVEKFVPLEGTLKEIEKDIILKVLEEEKQNQTRAAKRLGINRATLWRKLKN